MPTKIIDLDELIAPPRRVKLKGVTYTLPGELPVPLYLRLKATEDAPEDEAGGDRVEDLNELLLELFRVHQPDLDELPVGLTQAFTIIPRVYGASTILDENEGDDGEPDGPKQGTGARTGKPNTRRRATPRSRS